VKRLAATILYVLPAVAAVGADRTDVEGRIRRVERQIAPAVLVQGEPPATQSLASRMSDLKVPGVSIAVIHQGRIEWARGYGVTRVGGPPVSADTLFQAASISKPVFALAVLHLVEGKKLDLDTDVNTYLKQWKLPENEFTRQKKVTLRELLSHSAGTTVGGFPGYAADAPIPSLLQVLDGRPPANSAEIRVDTVPGSRWRYSGGGYVVAQQILQDVSGKPLPLLMRETVLAPLGMERSTYEQPLPVARQGEIAWPYHGDGTAIEGGPHIYPEMAPAGLWTTPSDLAHYALGVQSALAGKSSKVISAATAREMLTPVIGHQGLGPVLGGSAARGYFMHDGANEGYRCSLVSYTEGDGAVVMASSDSGGELTHEIMRTIAQVYGWPDFAPPVRVLRAIKPELLDRLAGAYQMSDGRQLVVRRVGDQLVSQEIGTAPLTLYPSSDHEFFARDIDVTLDFEVVAGQPVTALRHHYHSWERTATRMDAASERQLLARVERTALRVKENKPLAGSEAIVRETLEGLARGEPNYSRMNPAFADLTRQQLSGLQKFMGTFGALRKLEFDSVTPEGGDLYRAEFENGRMRVQLRLSEDGRIDGVDFLPP